MTDHVGNGVIYSLIPSNEGEDCDIEDLGTQPNSLLPAEPSYPQRESEGSFTILGFLKSLRRLWSFSRILLPRKMIQRDVYVPLMGLLVASLVFLSVGRLVGELAGIFYEALLGNNQDKFQRAFMWGIACVVCVSVAKSCSDYFSERLALGFRVVLTNASHEVYLRKEAILRKLRDGEHLDPSDIDQRICADTQVLTQELSSAVGRLISAPVTIVWYSCLVAMRMGFLPWMVVLSYFIAGYLIQRIFIKRLVALEKKNDLLEGKFRHSHRNFSEHHESIFFSDGVRCAGAHLRKMFSDLEDNSRNIIAKRMFLHLCVTLFSYIGSILNYVLLGWLVFYSPAKDRASELDDNESKAKQAKFISESSFYCLMLIHGFSTAFEISPLISRIAASVDRLERLWALLLSADDEEDAMSIPPNLPVKSKDEMEDCCAEEFVAESQTLSSPNRRTIGKGRISFDDVTIQLPSGSTLLKDIMLHVESGDKVLVHGPSGCGKTTIFRMIKGLWWNFSGQLEIPQAELVYVCPQSPFLLPEASLLEQIVFPYEESIHFGSLCDVTGVIRGILVDMRMEYLIERASSMESPMDWTCLSEGEKQKIALARVLFYFDEIHNMQDNPVKFVLLDECTSHVDERTEDIFYGALKTRMGPHVGLVSIGHRATLRQHHDLMWNVEDGVVNVKKIEKEC